MYNRALIENRCQLSKQRKIQTDPKYRPVVLNKVESQRLALAQFSSELHSCFTFKCLSWYRKGIVSDISNLTKNERPYLILGHLKFGTNYKVLKYKIGTFRFMLQTVVINNLTISKRTSANLPWCPSDAR